MNNTIKTILSFSLLAMLIPFSSSKAAEPYDLVKVEGNSSVYLIQEDGKRYVFPNEDIYFSWYPDYSKVKTISNLELASYPIGANLTIRPGTKLIKITTDPKVYVVESNCYLRHIPDEDTAIALYGPNWAKRVIDIPDTFFMNYNIGSAEIDSNFYPKSSLIQKMGSEDIYYINPDGRARKFSSRMVFQDNGFNLEDIITVPSDYILPLSADDINGAEKAMQYPGASCYYERTTDSSENDNWITYSNSDFNFMIDYPKKLNDKVMNFRDIQKIDYKAVHYAMYIEQMSITIYPISTYEFLDIKQSECFDSNDEESCTSRNKVSCGSGECTEIINEFANMQEFEPTLYSKKINRCYADPYKMETICPEPPNFEDNVLIVKNGDYYYKINQPIFTSTSMSDGEIKAYERMINSFKFINN